MAYPGLIIAWAIATFLPWRLLPSENTMRRPPAWAENPASLSLKADPESVDTSPNRFGFSSRRINVSRAPVRLMSIEPGWSAGVELRSATLTVNRRVIDGVIYSEGTSFFGGASDLAVADSDEPTGSAAVRQVLGVQSLVDVMPRGAEPRVVFATTSDDFARVGTDAGEYVGRFELTLTRSPDWLSDAELVVVDMAQQGTVARVLRIANFRLSTRSS